MQTLIFGSCRVKRFRAHLKNSITKKKFDICQHHLHNPYEILQIIQWLSAGNFDLAKSHDRFHNEIATRTNNDVDNYYENLSQKFLHSDRIAIEISSIKRLVKTSNNSIIDCNLTSVSHLRKNNPEEIDSITESIPNYKDFFSAIKSIKEATHNKELIIIPHYSWDNNGTPLQSRSKLRQYIAESCNTLGINIIDPDPCISKFKERNKICIDSSHYTERFEQILARFISKNI